MNNNQTGLMHCKIREQAEHVVEQWDTHGQYKETNTDKALHDPCLGEPIDVAIARHFLQLLTISEQTVKSAFNSHASNRLLKIAVDYYRRGYSN